MSDRTISFNKFLSLPNAVFKSIGMEAYTPSIEPQTHFAYKHLQGLFFLANFFSMNLILVGEFTYSMIAFSTSTHMKEGFLNVACSGFISVCVLKTISIWMKKSQLSELIRNLEQLYPKTAVDQQNYKVAEFMDRCYRIGVPYARFSVILVWFYNVLPATNYFVLDYLLGFRKVELKLPYPIYMPWDYANHWSFYVLYVIECLAGHLTMTGQAACDVLLYVVVTQLLMHFKCLSETIENYEAIKSTTLSKSKANANANFMKRAIKYHQKILHLSENVNEIFGVSLLVNFMSSSLVICFAAFLMTIKFDNDVLVVIAGFLALNLMQVYFISYYGEELVHASTGVGQAAYNHDWQNAELPYRKMLVLIEARAQKPAILKATSFLNVSLTTMTTLMQVSYKFFALLRTMYAE